MIRIRTLGILIAAWVALAGCSAPPAASPTSVPSPTSAPALAAVTEAPYDAKFIDSMVEHHQGAVMMANDALKNAQRPEIKTLAEAIIKAQEAEIKQMQDWRKAWFPDLPATGGTGMSMGMMEVAPGSEPYDLRFIDAMIPHHQGAIMMANDALKNAERPEIKTLSEEIIKAQEAEIAQMREWRAAWSDSADATAKSDALIQVPVTAMVMGSELSIDLVKSPDAGWLVIHAANGDEAGDVIGYTAVPAGESKNVVVKVSAVPAKVMAMLHADKGVAGQYEFPGDDAPLMVDGKPVTASFSTMAH